MIDVGEAEGILEEEEGELIHSIIEFGDTRVSEVMTPRPDIVALPVTATVREARDVILEFQVFAFACLSRSDRQRGRNHLCARPVAMLG